MENPGSYYGFDWQDSGVPNSDQQAIDVTAPDVLIPFSGPGPDVQDPFPAIPQIAEPDDPLPAWSESPEPDQSSPHFIDPQVLPVFPYSGTDIGVETVDPLPPEPDVSSDDPDYDPTGNPSESESPHEEFDDDADQLEVGEPELPLPVSSGSGAEDWKAMPDLSGVRRTLYLALQPVLGWRATSALTLSPEELQKLPSSDEHGEPLSFAERLKGEALTRVQRLQIFAQLRDSLPTDPDLAGDLASGMALRQSDRNHLESRTIQQQRRARRDALAAAFATGDHCIVEHADTLEQHQRELMNDPEWRREREMQGRVIDSEGRVSTRSEQAALDEREYFQAGVSLQSPGGSAFYGLAYFLGYGREKRMQAAEIGDNLWGLLNEHVEQVKKSR